MTATQPVHLPITRTTFWGSLGGVLLALAASVALALHEVGGTSLPGCGPASPCEHATASAWSAVPGIGLPVSIVGAAYFTGASAWWLASRRGALDRWGRRLIQLGGAASVVFLIAALAQRIFCSYCLAAHLGNLLFVTLVQSSARRAGARSALSPGLLAGAVLGVIVLGGFSWEWSSSQRAARDKSERALAQSTRALAQQPASAPGFRGRYLVGPRIAKVRVVVFSDFQCVACEQVESDLLTIAGRNPDIQVSLKHFPLCADCNSAATETIHPNACNAAIAAEAAGVVGGQEAFWKAAAWLFQHGGEFATDRFIAEQSSLGLDANRLASAIKDPRTLASIKQDVDEGLALGIARTPAIYVNGVELRGWEAPDAIRRAIDVVLAADPAPGGGESDRPAPADAKAIGDWRSSPRVGVAMRNPAPANASGEPPVRIIIFGDYQDPSTQEADEIIRRYTATWPGTAYEFRHFPASSQCNPRLKVNIHPLACRMARVAEAARVLGGPPAFERMHRWLFEHRQDFSDAGVRTVAAELQLNPTMLIAATKDARAQAAFQSDIDAGNALGITAIPAIYVNQRHLAVWKTRTGELITRALDLAAQEASAPPPAK